MPASVSHKRDRNAVFSRTRSRVSRGPSYSTTIAIDACPHTDARYGYPCAHLALIIAQASAHPVTGAPERLSAIHRGQSSRIVRRPIV